MATEDERYKQSSQFRFWTFTPAALAERRQKNNQTTKDNITARSAQIWDAENTALEKRAVPEFLSAEDEALLVTFYTVELMRAGQFMELPTEVWATAAVLFRRFYVTSSIMTYPPPQILKTALFFGCKAEGYFMPVSKFQQKLPNTKEDEVLAGEYLLAAANRFAYDVRHPFRGLEGAVMELRRLGEQDERRLGFARDKARTILKFSSLVTDAYFHYTPSQIMFAALSLADHGLVEKLFDSLFTTNGADTSAENGNGAKVAARSAAARAKVIAAIEACRSMLATEPPERMEYWATGQGMQATKPLRKKLKVCHDLDRWDLVKLQQIRRQQGEAKKPATKDDPFADGAPEAKRRKVSSEDPFGPALG